MKLVRFGDAGSEKPGIVDADGAIRDLSGHVADIDGAALQPASLDALRAIDINTLPLAPADARIGACVTKPGKFMCIGLNYRDHAAETGSAIPDHPVLFMKATSAMVGPNDDVVMPRGSTQTDWEVELGVVIGKTAKYVSKENALDHVAGYCVINDVSERHFQKDLSGQFTKGKSCDTYGPVGPWLVTADEVADPQKLSLYCDVNGKRMQDGTTADMIFSVADVIEHLSSMFTLHAGDIISTGTPAGVGLGMKPEPVFVKVGDVMQLGVEGLGSQRQNVKQDS